jgi:hypothetical protein
MVMAEYDTSEDGFPVLLATRAAGQVAAQRTSGVVVFRGARSGNASFDPASGRFAGKAPGRTTAKAGADVVVTQQTQNLPQGVTAEQMQKRSDIVRFAARQLAVLDPEAAKRFLEGHPNVTASQVNMDMFLRDVRAQRVQDLVDILHEQSNGGGPIRVTAAGRVSKRIFNQLDDSEMVQVAKRLEGMGWTPDVIRKDIIQGMASKGRRSALEQIYGEKKK